MRRDTAQRFRNRLVLVASLFAFTFAAWLTSPVDVWAKKPVTVTVSELSGTVNAMQPGGKTRALSVGDKLNPNDVIESGPKSRAVLSLDDGSKVEVFEATRIELNDILPQEESRFSLSLFFGRIAAKLRSLRGDDVVITPTMVAGVRGTDFSVGVADDGTSVVSVSEGTVRVASDPAADASKGVDVPAGREVSADRPGAILTPQPVTLDSLEAFLSFRQARLTAMKANVKDIVGFLEKRIDPGLESLDKLKAAPQDRGEVLKKLDERLKALGPADAVERAKLTIQTHMEAANMIDSARQFRIQRMRLNHTFAQSERLQSMLPSFAETLGPAYATVDEGIKRILAREEGVKAQTAAMAEEFKASVETSSPLLEKFMKPQFGQ